MNFYDYFEELPKIIDDDNQEIYHPMSSLIDQDNNLNKKNDLENIIFDKKLDFEEEDKLIPYYCSICGFNILNINIKINKFQRRELDLSICINPNEKNIFLKFYFILKNNIKYIKNKEENIEKRIYKLCDCGIEIGYYLEKKDEYINEKEDIIFILNDSLVYDFKKSQFISYLSKIPNLNI